nr:MAG TPA: Neurohypophysial hormone [Caudoviricetes sp.]
MVTMGIGSRLQNCPTGLIIIQTCFWQVFFVWW